MPPSFGPLDKVLGCAIVGGMTNKMGHLSKTGRKNRKFSIFAENGPKNVPRPQLRQKKLPRDLQVGSKDASWNSLHSIREIMR